MTRHTRAPTVWCVFRSLGVGLCLLVLGTPTFAAAQEAGFAQLQIRGWIGVAEGPEEEQFGKIVDLLQDDTGKVFILDGLLEVMRVFGPDGSYLFSVGGSGNGPGEFREVYCIAQDRADRIWIAELGGFEVFEPEDDGAEMRPYATIPSRNAGLTGGCPMFPERGGPSFPAFGDGSHGAHVRLDEDGRVVSRVDLPRHVEGESLGWKTLRVRQGRGVIQDNELTPPIGPQDLLRRSRDGRFARIVTTDYRVQLFDSEGVPRHQIRRDVRGPRVGEADRRSINRQQDSLERVTRRYRIGAYPAFPVPDRYPPISDLGFDLNGRLWVELSRPEDATVARAEVFGLEGELLFTATWPAFLDLRYAAIRDSIALGIAVDEFGIQRVARLGFRQP